MLAAVLAAGPGAALCQRSAGKLRDISRFHPPHIAVVTIHQRRPKGVEVHRVRSWTHVTSRPTRASR